MPEDVRRAADLLERRWLLQIVYAAHLGAVRFNEFRQAVGAVPPRTLAARLVELEEAGVLERRVVDARPPRVEYLLTEEGQRLPDRRSGAGKLGGRALGDTSGRGTTVRRPDRKEDHGNHRVDLARTSAPD